MWLRRSHSDESHPAFTGRDLVEDLGLLLVWPVVVGLSHPVLLAGVIGAIAVVGSPATVLPFLVGHYALGVVLMLWQIGHQRSARVLDRAIGIERFVPAMRRNDTRSETDR